MLLALTTYIFWGFLSLFWKLLANVNAYSTLSYRIIFTVLTMLIYMLVSGRKKLYRGELGKLLKNKKDLGTMIIASLLISMNWLVYIYAVGHGQATEASLDYYMMPIVSVVLSLIFLHERLSNVVSIAILLAGLGVAILVINTGRFPLISLILAFTFGLYGLVKKSVRLPSDLSMIIEAGLVLPIALIYLIFFAKESMVDYSLSENLLLIISGLVTSVPLLLFAEAVKRAPLNIVGFVQYINPTIQLSIAVLIFQEGITSGELRGFAFIWLSIAIFVLGQILDIRRKS